MNRRNCVFVNGGLRFPQFSGRKKVSYAGFFRYVFGCAVLVLLAGCTKTECAEQTPFSERSAALDSAELNVPAGSAANVDYDLSKMNANLVYATVFNMLIEPERYESKKLRMTGNFAVYEDPVVGKKTYAVIISDALACCQQGIEFHYDFSGDEPPLNALITVTGTFVISYINDGVMYNYVQADSVEK